MKKMKLFLLLTIIIFSCKTQDNKKDLIEKFINEVILDESYNINTIYNYIDVNKDSLNSNPDLLKMIDFNIDYLRSEIKDSKLLEILTYKDFKKRNHFSSYNINYSNSEAIYCLVINNKLISPIIINDKNKISSFFTGLIKHKDKIEPYMLNK